jgi:hypothetical protein
MTLQTTGHISLNNINGEFSKGRDFAPYHGVKFYKPSTSTLGNFSTNTLHMSDFYGTQNGIIINVTISSDTQNYVLSPSNGSISPTYVAGFTTINLTINSGIYVGSTTTGTYSFTVSGFTTGDTINLINNGIIIGCGGAGGNGHSNAAGDPGYVGGPALYLQYATNITNNGTISGGGGGGGAADGGTTYGSCLGGGSAYTGQGGGGGAGYTPGNGGSGSPSASNGTRTAGGAGAATGGGPGQAGATSGNGRAGGAAGNYIVGQAYANWLVLGTVLGGSS